MGFPKLHSTLATLFIHIRDELRVGQRRCCRDPFAEIGNVMFVIDTTNTKPGASGRLWIKRAALQK